MYPVPFVLLPALTSLVHRHLSTKIIIMMITKNGSVMEDGNFCLKSLSIAERWIADKQTIYMGSSIQFFTHHWTSLCLVLQVLNNL